MDVRCQCGAVHFKTPTPAPLSVYHCHCVECQKQSSSAFGTSAIFAADGVFPLSPELEAKMGLWTRPSEAGRTVDCYFCKECGVRIMHRIREHQRRAAVDHKRQKEDWWMAWTGALRSTSSPGRRCFRSHRRRKASRRSGHQTAALLLLRSKTEHLAYRLD